MVSPHGRLDLRSISTLGRERPLQEPPGSGFLTQTAGRALTLPRATEPTQALHQHRVVGERLRKIDQGVENLVVARRRHAEEFGDRVLLGSRVAPPLTLEGKN